MAEAMLEVKHRLLQESKVEDSIDAAYANKHPELFKSDKDGEWDADDNGKMAFYCGGCGCDECYCTDESNEASDVEVDGIEEDSDANGEIRRGLGGKGWKGPRVFVRNTPLFVAKTSRVVMGLRVLKMQPPAPDADNEEVQAIEVREQAIKNICSNGSNDAMDIEENNLKHCNCAICFDILKDATSLNCGHTFCSTCVEVHRQRWSNPLCPNCRVVITGAYPNYFARDILNSMKAGLRTNDTTRPSSPNLMGMPDILLEKILHYVTHSPSELCLLETVSKRVCRMLRGDEFWARHPFIYPKSYYWVNLFGDDERNRRRFFHMNGMLQQMKRYKHNAMEEDAIITVLGGADEFQDVVDNIVFQMIYCGTFA